MEIPQGFALPLSTQDQRWSGFFRSELKKGGNRYMAKYKFCLSEFSDKPERLHQHVLKCSDWPPLGKATYLSKISNESPTSHKRTHEEEEEDISTEHNGTQQSFESPRQSTILNWYNRPLPNTQSEKLHQKLLKAIIYRNLSFNFVKNPYLQEYLSELNPAYHLPSRDMIKGRLLTTMFSDHLQKKLNAFPSLTNITISLDGWTDNSENSIYGFMALNENQENVLDILDLSAH
ncbi:530_t:CDS:1, partial [Cetraspora pellucida]